MPTIIGFLAVVGLLAVGWEYRRRGARRALRVWAWSSPLVALLAVAVIALDVTGSDVGRELLGLLAVAVAAMCVAMAFASRTDARG